MHGRFGEPHDQYGLELVLSPLLVDVSATGDITTRNQQVALMTQR